MPENKGSSPANDRDLLIRARKLDESALSAIFDAYYDPLYRYIYRHIGVSLTAEDLAAEVFRSFLEEIKDQRGPTTYLKAWLYRVAHNLIVDELRRNKHRDHDPLDENQHADEPEVAERALQSVVEQSTKDALEQLTDKQRAVLMLRYMQGLQIDEIAQTLNMSTGTVKALQHRGLQAMRRYLKQSGMMDEMDL
jgi:RNA polymerase sigma-70 factor (ECF subfamily)